MSRVAAWFLVIYSLIATGVAVYEFSFIQHLEFIIGLLAGGVRN